MTWNIVHERTHAHPYRGRHDPKTRYQIIGVDDEVVELSENRCWYRKIPREKWPEFYENNLRRARSAEHTAGKGSIVPYYQGVQPVSEASAEMLRNPFVPQLYY